MRIILIIFFSLIGAVAFAQSSAIVKSEFIFEEVPFKECHASTIESTQDGLVAAWFGGTKEGNKDVEIWISRKNDAEWTEPESVANGIQHKDKRYPTFNPVLFQYPDGPLKLFYKVSSNAREWGGPQRIMVKAGQEVIGCLKIFLGQSKINQYLLEMVD